MISYLDQLKAHAEHHGVFLYKAFEASDVTQPTYSRTIRGKTNLHLSTAIRVWAAIEALAAEEKERDGARRDKAFVHRLKVVRDDA